VMRAQMEKYKLQLGAKVSKNVESEVLASSPVVAVVVVEEKKKVLKKKPVTSKVSSPVDVKVVSEKENENVPAPVAVEVKTPEVKVVEKKIKKSKPLEENKSVSVVSPSAVVDMKSVDEKIAEVMRAQAEVMRAQAEKMKEKMSSSAAEVKSPESKVVEKKVKKTKSVEEKKESPVVVVAPVEKVVEKVVEEETVELAPVEVESTVLFRYKDQIYKKSKVGILYDRHSEVRLGKVDESGKVVLDAQEVEEELCSEEESGSEDEYESDA